MRARATSDDDAVVFDDDDDQGVLGEALAWTCRMGVRLAVVPLVVLALPALVRAAATFALAALAAFSVALPFMFALAVMTWRKLTHGAPATRFEPRASRPRDESVSANRPDVPTGCDPDDGAIRTVAVIGGGAAGLAALRQMLSRGLDATLFERADDVGGLWNYDDPRASKVFNGVVQNVTKRHNRFSGHPAPARWPLYLGHAHTLEYLRSYAEKHNLARHVRTRREVTSCERRPDGRFEVRHRPTPPPGSVSRRDASPSSVLRARDAAEGEIQTDDANDAEETSSAFATARETVDAFDAVCVCTGQLSRPNLPRVPGLETFPGRVAHTSEYRVPSDFAGARVLIVGTGAASGSDIAQDLCGCAASVTVSVRTERWILSRGLLAGRPTWLLRASARVPAWLGVLLTLYADWIPCFRRLSPGMTDSKDFLNAVALGRVSLAKTVRSVAGSTVTFADGASADFDVVVFATGFSREVPFIHKSLRPETRGLYKGALVPSEPRVGYCLFVLPFGSHFQVAELQAAWLAQVWSGSLPTPSVADMLRLARPVPVVAAHEKLGEYHRMQYLALLRPALFPLARWAWEDPVRLFRAAWARYADPVFEWDPNARDGNGAEDDGGLPSTRWKGFRFA